MSRASFPSIRADLTATRRSKPRYLSRLIIAAAVTLLVVFVVGLTVLAEAG